MAHLTITQRYEIATLRNQNFSQGKIADIIGKDKSVVSRELKRNCDARNGLYRAELAQKKANLRHEAKPKKVYFTTAVKAFVVKYLDKEYSPEQIVGYAKKEKINCVSIERIYRGRPVSLFGKTKSKEELITCTYERKGRNIERGGKLRIKEVKSLTGWVLINDQL